jgi:NitT/TauT family transport system ATP-binding protein
MATIQIENLSKRFPSRNGDEDLVVLDAVDLAVQDRQFLCLLGRSGCGKSTLLNVISGLDRDYGGHVAFDGHALAHAARPPVKIGYVFQEPRLLPWRTVRENLRFALQSSGLPQDEWSDRAETWLERVGLSGFRDAYPHELSGGMQQRAAIARAFAIDPEVLLMDEPFSGLDEFTGRALRAALLSLWRDTRKTVIFVTHHCFEACYLADRIVLLGGRPSRIARTIDVELPRPRDYDSSELFELSVDVTRAVTSIPGGNAEQVR